MAQVQIGRLTLTSHASGKITVRRSDGLESDRTDVVLWQTFEELMRLKRLGIRVEDAVTPISDP